MSMIYDTFYLVYDCPVFDGMEDFARTIVSASLTAATLLLENKVHTAINWSGGWHHARRDTASGFCYVNDVVLSIHKLQVLSANLVVLLFLEIVVRMRFL